jgi:phosphotriesterase-related protein
MDSIRDFEAHDKALELGVWLSYDRIQGWDLVHQLRPWEVEYRVDLLSRAQNSGDLNRLLLSTDCCVLGDLSRYGGPGYAYTHGVFAQSLKSIGFTAADLEVLFKDNPRRALTGG